MSTTTQQITIEMVGSAAKLGRLLAAEIADKASEALRDKGDTHGAYILAGFAEFLRTDLPTTH
jgi:hypothetical protein